MKRREFITLLGGAAAAWPVGPRAQQSERMRRVGVLMNAAGRYGRTTPSFGARAGAAEMGWTIGRNLHIETRGGAGDANRYRRYAAELVGLAPDVMLVNGPAALAHLQQATRSVPILFTSVIDPAGGGFIANLARPGGNVTGFMPYEFSLSGKLLELLKEIAPNVTPMLSMEARRDARFILRR